MYLHNTSTKLKSQAEFLTGRDSMSSTVLTEKKGDNLQDEVKIGNTVFIVNQIFAPKQSKQEAWLSIITRAESLKTGQ